MPPGDRGKREARRRRRRRDRRAAVAAARGDRARRRGAGQLHRSRAWRSRSRCASTTCRTSSRVAARKAARQAAARSARRATARGRVDLTALPLVTIDGETAKDFDDAVYCERKGRGFRLLVAIADVSHYVRDGDALDRDARERGTSVYFPRRVIPMLPEALSNELCSLKPDVDRLCMVCEMEVTAEGAIRKLPVLPGGDALARAAHLHRRSGSGCRSPQSAPAGRRRRCCRISSTSTRSTRRSRRRARSAARSTSTPSRCSSSSTSTARSCASCRSCATTRTG